MRFRSELAIGTLCFALALGLAPDSARSADAEAGKAAYTTNCISCHGVAGKGDGPVGAALTPPPRDLSKGEFKFDTDGDGKPGTDADLKEVIAKGAAAFGGSPLMAPWGHLGAAEIENLVAYIHTLKQ